jgi:hypothetical protein
VLLVSGVLCHEGLYCLHLQKKSSPEEVTAVVWLHIQLVERGIFFFLCSLCVVVAVI